MPSPPPLQPYHHFSSKEEFDAQFVFAYKLWRDAINWNRDQILMIMDTGSYEDARDNYDMAYDFFIKSGVELEYEPPVPSHVYQTEQLRRAGLLERWGGAAKPKPEPQ